jgi:hypothetical protein
MTDIQESTREQRDEIKSMIIENYIDWFTHDEEERNRMKADVSQYVDFDHVDEIGQAFEIYPENEE